MNPIWTKTTQHHLLRTDTHIAAAVLRVHHEWVAVVCTAADGHFDIVARSANRAVAQLSVDLYLRPAECWHPLDVFAGASADMLKSGRRPARVHVHCGGVRLALRNWCKTTIRSASAQCITAQMGLDADNPYVVQAVFVVLNKLADTERDIERHQTSADGVWFWDQSIVGREVAL